MSIDTQSEGDHDPSAELPGVHDRLRRAYEAAHDGEWEEYEDILHGALSEGKKRKAKMLRQGGSDE